MISWKNAAGSVHLLHVRFVPRTLATLVLPLFLVVLLYSCKEDDHDHMHGEPYDVDIAFLEPAADATIDSGQELHMEVQFSSAGTIHNVKVRVFRDSDAAEVFLWEQHVHEESGSFEFHEHLTLTTSTHEDYTIEASTWDHDAESTPIVATRSFHLHP
jgi:hypothetical protein